MEKNQLLSDIDRVFGGIQHLQIAPTKDNIAILFDTMNVLEGLYNYVKERTGNAANCDHSGD